MAIRQRQDGCYCVDMTGWVDPLRRADEPRRKSILRLLDLFRDQQDVIAGFHWVGTGDGRDHLCFDDIETARRFAGFVGMDATVTGQDVAAAAAPGRDPPG